MTHDVQSYGSALSVRVLTAATGVVFCIAAIPYLSNHYAGSAGIYPILATWGVLLVFGTLRSCFQKEGKLCLEYFGVIRLVKYVLFSGLIGIVLEAGTLFGAYKASVLVFDDWNMKRLLFFSLLTYSLALLCGSFCNTDLKRIQLKRCVYVWPFFRSRALVLVFAAAGVVGILMAFLVAAVTDISHWASLVFCVCAGLSLAGVICYLRSSRWKVEYLFLLLAIPMGLVYVLAFPVGNLFSWDDEVHYQRALSLSYFADVETTASDRMITSLFHMEDGFDSDASFGRYPIDVSDTWTQAQVDELANQLNQKNSADTAIVQSGVSPDALSLTSIGYIPSALGLWIGRFLHLPFTINFMMGRLFNLVSYCVVTFFAIRIVPVKKILMGVIALMPTCIFMAANYSYDPWVISFTHLALALFLREYLSRDAINWFTVAASMTVFFFAFAPKAVYFPIMGIALLFYTKTGIDKKKRRQLVAVAVFIALLLVSSFMLQLLFPAPGFVGDFRGGTEVNNSAQFAYVLDNPFGYIIMMLKFLIVQYLPVLFQEGAMTNLAYMGQLQSILPWISGFIAVCLAVVSVLDSDNDSIRLVKLSSVLWTAFVVFCALALVCTSLYISFTAVGADSIAGVQARYAIPLYYLALTMVISFKVTNRMSWRCFSGSTLLASGVLGYACSWLLLVSRILI